MITEKQLTNLIEREHSVSYQCDTCGPAIDKVMSPAEFKEHLQTTHYCTEFKGQLRMNLHLDTSTHYISAYDGELQGIKFVKSTRTERETAFKLRKLKAERGEKPTEKELNALPPLMP